MFIALHNLIAAAEPGTTAHDIYIQWLNYHVLESNDDQIVTVANIIGGAYDDFIIENFMTKKLRTLLSPASLTDRARRPVFTEFPFIPVQLNNTLPHTNPYFYLIPTSNSSQPMAMTFLNSARSFISQTFVKCIDLYELFNNESGTAIMNHFYCSPRVPTFYCMRVKVTPTATPQTLANFAAKIQYKCRSSCSVKPKHKVTEPHDDVDYQRSLYLCAKHPKNADPDALHAISAEFRSPQPVLLYSPWNTGVSSLYYPLTSGLCIESYEIDGFHIPFPHNTTSINHENSYFKESMIPMTSTTNYTFYDGNSILSTRMRTQTNHHEHKISMSYFDMSQHRLPVYPPQVGITNLQDLLPGFTPIHGVLEPAYASNKIAYSGNINWTKHTCDRNIPDPFQAWSSYRWIDPQYANIHEHCRRKFFIMNFRTTHGTLNPIVAAPFLYDIVN